MARHYYTFSDSNVKRRLVRMLFFLRAEVDRLRPQGATADGDRPPWVERVSRPTRG